MNSKNKGSSFERLISKKISLWYSNGEKDDLFYRTSNSGGRFTVRINKGKETSGQHGDVCSYSSESELFSKNILIECKHYKDADLWSLFTESKGDNIFNWWKEAVKESVDSKTEPMLVVRQNNRPILLLTSTRLTKLISLSSNLTPYMQILSMEMLPSVYKFEDFLSIDSNMFKLQMMKEFD